MGYMGLYEITQKYLNKERIFLNETQQELKNLPRAYRGLDPVQPSFTPGEKTYFGAKGQHFTQSENPFRRENLVNSTYFGLKTRLKSEAIIAESLYRAGLSVHYEKKIILYDELGKQKTAYMDFIIPLTPYYEIGWEHNGLCAELSDRTCPNGIRSGSDS